MIAMMGNDLNDGVWLFGVLGWVALLVVWGAPPVCPPRSPSPWPSPAERERGENHDCHDGE